MHLPMILADELDKEAAQRANDILKGLPGWMGNPFLTLVILGFVTLAAVAWLSYRQRKIAENQARLARMLRDVSDRVDEALEELEEIE